MRAGRPCDEASPARPAGSTQLDTRQPLAAGGLRRAMALLPGLGLCVTITLAAVGLQRWEEAVFTHPYVEALVLAILLGIAVRSIWSPGALWRPGIAFSAKLLLEIAVMLLGASISLAALVASGPALLAGIVATVAAALAASYAACQALGLPRRISILIACGNSICGNSAIAAVAPVIGADGDDIASSIAFTAILGVVVVLGLPLFIPLLNLSDTQYGVLAGLTVYAVPQVLAATIPFGLVAAQLGTLVKLVRVLMLGPLVVVLSLVRSRLGVGGAADAHKPGLLRLVPWFIVGFIVLAAARSLGLVPVAALPAITVTATILTVISMAALGLGVDIRVIGRVGGRVTLAVVVSLAVLIAISIGLIRLLHVA